MHPNSKSDLGYIHITFWQKWTLLLCRAHYPYGKKKSWIAPVKFPKPLFARAPSRKISYLGKKGEAGCFDIQFARKRWDICFILLKDFAFTHDCSRTDGPLDREGAALSVHLLRLLDFVLSVTSASCTRKVASAWKQDAACCSRLCWLVTNPRTDESLYRYKYNSEIFEKEFPDLKFVFIFYFL